MLDLRLVGLKPERLLHDVERVPAGDRLQQRDFGFAGLLVARADLQPHDRRKPALLALPDRARLRALAVFGPQLFEPLPVGRRRDIGHAEEDLHREHVGPVFDRLPARHHLRHLLARVPVLEADDIAVRHGDEEVLVLQLRVGWDGEDERGEEDEDDGVHGGDCFERYSQISPRSSGLPSAKRKVGQFLLAGKNDNNLFVEPKRCPDQSFFEIHFICS